MWSFSLHATGKPSSQSCFESEPPGSWLGQGPVRQLSVGGEVDDRSRRPRSTPRRLPDTSAQSPLCWSNTPLHWVPGDPFATHFWNALHLILPEGERGFIKAVNEAAPLVDDPELTAPIKAFVQQESWHAWAHQVVLDHLAEEGIDTKPYTDKLQKWLSAGTNQHPGCLRVYSDGGSTGAWPTWPRSTLHGGAGPVVDPKPRPGLRRNRPGHA